jgi:hypothetical protein
VNESKAKKQRYWVAFLLDDLSIDATFYPGLLHLTIIPWFVSDLPEEEIIKSFQSTFSGLPTVELEVGKQVSFGPENNVAVNLVRDNPNLMNIHKLSLDWFERISARWAVKNPYAGEEYKPHIRRRGGNDLKQGDILNLNFMSLISANRQENNIRKVVARVSLNG